VAACSRSATRWRGVLSAARAETVVRRIIGVPGYRDRHPKT
jgi:hypothetical protein